MKKTTRLIIVIILLAVFCLIAYGVVSGNIHGFENDIYTYFAKHISPGLTKFMIFITNIGSPVGVIIIVVLLLIVPYTRIDFGITVIINTAIVGGLNTVLKLVFARPRPNILRLIPESGFSFPSGHAMNNAGLYAIIALLVFRKAKNKTIRIIILIISIIMPVLIGISRVYLGVHYAGDVLAGWILGVTIALVVDSFDKRIALKYNTKKEGE